MKLKDPYSIHFVPCTRTTELDATTAMLDSWYRVLRFESLTFTPSNIPLVTVAKRLVNGNWTGAYTVLLTACLIHPFTHTFK